MIFPHCLIYLVGTLIWAARDHRKMQQQKNRHRIGRFRSAIFGVGLAVGLTGALVGGFSGAAHAAAGWSCVPYARSVSAVELRGDAWRWWDNANGVYAKGKTPKPGSVLVFKKTRQMSRGHVAVVRQIVGNRKIIIDHANWSRDGKVETQVGVIDVSSKNDWSKTRVWYGPIKDYGSTTYDTYGFIYSGGVPEGPGAEPAATLQNASFDGSAEPVGKAPKVSGKTKLSERSLAEKKLNRNLHSR